MSEFPSPLLDPDQADLSACPACGRDVALAKGVVMGETLWCGHCGAELEVTSLDPVRLDRVQAR